MSDSIVVSADQVSIGHRSSTPRLDHVSVSIRSGRVHAFVGPNGSGKSTLLAVLAGDLPPDSGTVLIQGRPWSSHSPASAARLRALLAQDVPLAFAFTVREVVSWGRLPWRGSDTDDDAILTEAIAQNRLEELLDRTVPSLSGGERARVHLARVMAQQTPLLMLDEADAALDLAGQAHLDDAIHRRRSRGETTVLVSHDLARVAAVADEVTVLDRGRVVAQGPTSDILTAEKLSVSYGVPVRDGEVGDRRHFWVAGD